MDEVLLLIRIFLASVFIIAGVGKLADMEGSKRAFREFGVNDELSEGIAYALPIIEIGFAILLLPVFTAWFGAIGCFILLAVFIGGMLWQLAKGQTPDCHCFGAIHSEPVSWKSLIRNIIFAGFAFALVAQGNYNQGLGFTELTIDMAIQLIFGIVFVALLALAVFYLKKISEQQDQVMRRLEVIEVLAHEGGREVARDNVNAPQDGLPIGAKLPQFELKDLAGRVVTTKDIESRGRPMLFFFVSPTCTPCASLLPEIEEWQKEFSDSLDVVLISTGDSAQNAEKFGGKSFKEILLQEEREVGKKFRAEWTPVGIFINYDSVIGSAPAVGDAAIRELIAKLRKEDVSKVYAVGDVSGVGELSIGSEMPEFEVSDLKDNKVSNADLKGRNTLVMYWSMGCGHCRAMMPELIAWENAKSDSDPKLIVFSQGSVSDHEPLTINSPVLIEEGSKTAETLGMPGTPAAILVNEDGKIVSQVAVGAANIWALVGREPIAGND